MNVRFDVLKPRFRSRKKSVPPQCAMPKNVIITKNIVFKFIWLIKVTFKSFKLFKLEHATLGRVNYFSLGYIRSKVVNF